MTFGEKLKSLRTEYGYSLAELGKKLGVTASYLSRVERGKAPPSDRLVYVVAKEFNAPHVFDLAGKDIPNDFPYTPPRMSEEDQNNLRKTYPESDPYAKYAKYNKKYPDLLDDLDVEQLFNLEILSEDMYMHPTLRKEVIKWRQWNADTYTIEDNNELGQQYITAARLMKSGYVDGIRFAYASLKQVKKEKGDYVLLSAFYEPETAKAIADYLETLRRLLSKDKEATGQVTIFEMFPEIKDE